MNKLLYFFIASISIILISSSLFAESVNRIDAEKLFVQAQKALASGNNEIAENLLMKSLQRDPNFTSAIWQLSQIYENRGKLEYARELLLRGLQQNQNATWAKDKLKRMERILVQKLLSEATNFMTDGNYTSALPKLALYHGIKPYDPIPLIYMGRCHLALNNSKTAKQYLTEAMERDPSNSEIAHLLSAVDNRIERESLNEVILQAKKILSNFTTAKNKEATNALQAILQKDPGNAWAKEKLSELDLLTSKSTETENQKDGKKNTEGFKLKEKTSEAINILPAAVLKYTIIALLIITIILLSILKRNSAVKNYPLQGTINLIPILDIVSLINSNLKNGHLLIITEKSKGEVFFEKGEIIHARYKADDGTTAFHKIMAIQSGKYIFYNHLPKVKQTIQEPLSLLLLSMKPRNKLFPAEKSKSMTSSRIPV